MKLTTNTDETAFGNLLSRDLILSIPYFQRPYRWQPPKLDQLQEDLMSTIETDDSHFLGAIILFERQTSPTEPNHFEIIDGQQRTTTVFLFICAVIKHLARTEKQYDAAQLFRKYVVIDRPNRFASNLKLHSCREDRASMNRVIQDILGDQRLTRELGNFQFRPLPHSDTNNSPRVWNNYRHALRFVDRRATVEGSDYVDRIYTALLEAISIVQIIVKDPTGGPKIYNSLNASQEPMTTGHLVRNEIFSKGSITDIAELETIEQNSWHPFYSRFNEGGESSFDKYFFPFGLIKDPNVKKKDVFALLRGLWGPVRNPEDIIDDLSVYQPAFLDIVSGSNHQGSSRQVFSALSRLRDTKLPSSVHPFLMQLIWSASSDHVSEQYAITILNSLEEFFVRRAICGIEPTGLHAVFKRLWLDSSENFSPATVIERMARHRTVQWPTDEEVGRCIRERPLYGSSIVPFIISEYNKSLGGDPPGPAQQIEHVLPQNPDESWNDFFSREQTEELKNLLANLLPVSQNMNQILGNTSYAQKRIRYREDAAFRCTRKFADDYPIWNPDALCRRGNHLAQWVVSRWPDPRRHEHI